VVGFFNGKKETFLNITCTRRLEFDAGHRVMNHEGKCATLHGHRYVIEITASAQLDSLGRVIDFSALKALIGEWIEINWDHNTLVFIDDKKTLEALLNIPRKKDPWLSPFNPTAENIASYLLLSICPKLLVDTGVTVVSVTVFETPNCKAEAKL
jgi:6-pyruvoyltetrahydropterin/6-carboxytetrahydropterin synthase